MIEKSKKRLWLCWILLALNVAFIWGNSLMPGHISGALSDWLKDLLALIFGESESSGGGGLLRKAAHFIEFTCLGLLLSWLVRMLSQKPVLFYLLPLLIGAAVAGTDELIQCFVPDRGPSVWDVALDTCGAAVGNFVFCLVYFWKERSIMHSEE